MRTSFSIRALIAIITLSVRCLHAGEELIQAGPMVGAVTDTTASVWLRAGDGASISAGATQGEKSFKPAKIDSLGRGFYIVRFEGLSAATPTEATIEVERERKVSDQVKFRTFPQPSKTGRVRIAFSSCSKVTQHNNVPAYEAAAKEAPDAMLFLGDNSYFIVGGQGENQFRTSGPVGDWTSPELMIARHLETRTHPMVQNLIRSVPCYAVWDDHDFGPNNSDRGFPLKEEALTIFKQVWANPAYGTSGTKGIFGSFRIGPVEVFLMDDRFHKYVSTDEHKDVSPDEAEIWGEAQLKWLMEGLAKSEAPVKLIANGTQVISESKSGEGHFQEAPKERERLFSFLKEKKIGGIVFLSGDRHYSEVMRLQQPDGPDIMEFTSSPIGQGEKVRPLESKHRTQLWGMRGDGFGLVTVDIPAEEDGGAARGTIRLEARDAGNHVPILNAARCVTTVELRKLNY